MRRPAKLLIYFLFFSVFRILAQEPSFTSSVQRAPNLALQDAANQAADHAKKLGCKSASCLVLVLDFATTNGSTSAAGIQLAQDFGLLLAKPLAPARVVDSSTLKIFQAEERIPSKIFQDDKAIRWLGQQFHAMIVIDASVDIPGNPPGARFTLRDATDTKKLREFQVHLPPLSFTVDELNPSEPFPAFVSLNSYQGENVPQARSPGISPPSCTYMPNPTYTDAARVARFNGSVTFEGIITADGRLDQPRIVRGLPYGLNEAALETARTWRCSPASKDAARVNAVVAFEINFRLY